MVWASCMDTPLSTSGVTNHFGLWDPIYYTLSSLKPATGSTEPCLHSAVQLEDCCGKSEITRLQKLQYVKQPSALVKEAY